MRSLSRLFLLLAAALAGPPAAHADWLGLADGDYDLTLTCVSSSVPCPGAFHLSLTIDGTGATAMSTTFNGQVFSGDPQDGVFALSTFSSQRSILIDTPFSFLQLVDELGATSIPNVTGHWWDYCSNLTADSCAPVTDGNWVATAIAPVPEPSTTALIGLGLAGLVATRRRRGAPLPRERTPRRAIAPQPSAPIASASRSTSLSSL